MLSRIPGGTAAALAGLLPAAGVSLTNVGEASPLGWPKRHATSRPDNIDHLHITNALHRAKRSTDETTSE